jgi:hypothetical protein
VNFIILNFLFLSFLNSTVKIENPVNNSLLWHATYSKMENMHGVAAVEVEVEESCCWAGAIRNCNKTVLYFFKRGFVREMRRHFSSSKSLVSCVLCRVSSLSALLYVCTYLQHALQVSELWIGFGLAIENRWFHNLAQHSF